MLVLEALPTAIVATIWRALLADAEAVRALRVQGIAPILARLRMEGGKGPFSAHAAVDAEGAYRYARANDGRFMLEMGSTLYAPIGRTYGGGGVSGERVVAGRLFAEHVLTRLFAPDGQRRVRDLDFPGAPVVAESRDALPPFESIATLPPGATPLEPGDAARSARARLRGASHRQQPSCELACVPPRLRGGGAPSLLCARARRGRARAIGRYRVPQALLRRPSGPHHPAGIRGRRGGSGWRPRSPSSCRGRPAGNWPTLARTRMCGWSSKSRAKCSWRRRDERHLFGATTWT